MGVTWRWLAVVAVVAGCEGTTVAHHPDAAPAGGGAVDAAPSSSGPPCVGTCSLPNALGACVDGTCRVRECNAGFTDCNMDPTDGCEADLTSDANNCGMCGNACASQACGTSVTAPMTAKPTGWTFNGNAYWNMPNMTTTLTDATAGQFGSLVFDHAMVADSFDVSFDFRMVVGSTNPADGIAFMLEKNGATALGGGGGGLGVVGLTGWAVELDSYQNANGCGDVNANHVGIDLLEACPGGPATPNTQVEATPAITLRGTGFHTCRVHVVNGVATVSLDGKAVISNFSVPGFSAGAKYYFGFTGSNGSNYDGHGVKNVAITFPGPQCL